MRGVRQIMGSGSPGFLYVIRFDTGVIKAGRTNDLRRRSREHLRDAARFGVGVTVDWTSELVPDSVACERSLLGVLSHYGRRTAAGREYFRDVPFAVARYQAEIVVGQRVVDRSRDGLCDTDKIMRLAAVVDADSALAEQGELTAVLRLEGGDRVEVQLNDPDLGPAGRYPLRRGDRVYADLEKSGINSWDLWGFDPAQQR
ncbi:GIY-YIG nuclease family protein [Micromonospora sp. NPDC049900]|uniref:GIY-YIG nuclease family protein n=1 Tax=Micromonospora sp. NPDC049900 TaxID=3364275 RepID=UPI003793AEC9